MTAKRSIKRKNGHSRKTWGGSGLLEDCVDSLSFLEFGIFKSFAQFKKENNGGVRYVVRNYPCPSLYGTRGRKEAFIAAPCFSDDLARDEDGTSRCVMECKSQNSSGSTDEKLPYLYHACAASSVPNWLIVLDGKYWQKGRGLAAVEWLKSCPAIPGKRLIVVNRDEFRALAKNAWKPKP